MKNVTQSIIIFYLEIKYPTDKKAREAAFKAEKIRLLEFWTIYGEISNSLWQINNICAILF